MSYIDCSPIRLIWKYPTPRDIIVKHFLEKYYNLEISNNITSCLEDIISNYKEYKLWELL